MTEEQWAKMNEDDSIKQYKAMCETADEMTKSDRPIWFQNYRDLSEKSGHAILAYTEDNWAALSRAFRREIITTLMNGLRSDAPATQVDAW